LTVFNTIFDHFGRGLLFWATLYAGLWICDECEENTAQAATVFFPETPQSVSVCRTDLTALDLRPDLFAHRFFLCFSFISF